MKNESQISIFKFSDYREFLAQYYVSKKSKNSSYSHRVFAQQAGLSSPSHLLMIIKGERNLSQKTIPKFSEGLNLQNRERQYFELLVLYNQTNDLQLKAKYFSQMMTLKSALNQLTPLEKEKFEFLSKWYIVAIYVLIDLREFIADHQWIAKRLGGKVTIAQVKEAIEVLLRVGMVKREGETLKQLSGALTIADDTRSIAVYNYHSSMLRLASEALREVPSHEREMNGATIAIPKNKINEIKEKIRAFRKEINQLASSYENPDEVYQLNIQLFPLTELSEKKK